jgi:hypothetical protein
VKSARYVARNYADFFIPMLLPGVLTLNLGSSLRVGDQVPRLYKTTGKIIVLRFILSDFKWPIPLSLALIFHKTLDVCYCLCN